MDELSPIKDLLYSVLGEISESKIQEKLTKNDAKSLLKEIFSKADLGRLPGDKTQNYETFAESLMHYLLTNTLIPSQRKITVNQTDIDIVIPDVRTLKSSCSDAIVLVFPKTNDTKSIQSRLEKIQKIQSIKENIWLIQKTDLGAPYKTYEIDGNNSFFDIIQDIKDFTATKTQSKFKIFKV